MARRRKFTVSFIAATCAIVAATPGVLCPVLASEPAPAATVEPANPTLAKAYRIVDLEPQAALRLTDTLSERTDFDGAPKSLALFHYVNARVAMHVASYDESIRSGRLALTLLEGSNSRLLAETLNTLSVAYGRNRQTRQAIEFQQREYDQWRSLGDVRGEALSLSGLAELYFGVGLVTKGVSVYGAALDRARRSGDMAILAKVLNNFGYCLLQQDELEQAMVLLTEALDLIGRLNNPHLEAFIKQNTAHAMSRLGRLDEAETLTHEALKTAQALQQPKLFPGAYLTLARIAQQRGSYADAEALATEAMQHARGAGLIDQQSGIMLFLAEIAEQQGHFETAYGRLREHADYLQSTTQSALARSASLFEAETKLAAQQLELQLLRRDGKIAKMETARALLLRNAAIMAALIFAVTLLVLALLLREKALAKAQIERKNNELTVAYSDLEAANRVKSNFLAVISHELRTPLHSIIGFSDILVNGKSQSGSREFIADYAKIINAQGRALLRLVSDILLFARTDAGAITLQEGADSLKSIIAKAMARVAEAREGANGRVDLQIGEPNLTIRGDPNQLANCLSRILDNALKFSPAESRIILTTQRTAEGDLEIDITDAGAGMNVEDPKPFDVLSPGDQSLARGQNGAGLGLPIANLIAAAHDGRIVISRRPAGGTLVSVVLPASRIVEDAKAAA